MKNITLQLLRDLLTSLVGVNFNLNITLFDVLAYVFAANTGSIISHYASFAYLNGTTLSKSTALKYYGNLTFTSKGGTANVYFDNVLIHQIVSTSAVTCIELKNIIFDKVDFLCPVGASPTVNCTFVGLCFTYAY